VLGVVGYRSSYSLRDCCYVLRSLGVCVVGLGFIFLEILDIRVSHSCACTCSDMAIFCACFASDLYATAFGGLL